MGNVFFDRVQLLYVAREQSQSFLRLEATLSHSHSQFMTHSTRDSTISDSTNIPCQSLSVTSKTESEIVQTLPPLPRYQCPVSRWATPFRLRSKEKEEDLGIGVHSKKEEDLGVEFNRRRIDSIKKINYLSVCVEFHS